MPNLLLKLFLLFLFSTQSAFSALGPCGRVFYKTVTGVFTAEVLDSKIRDLVLFKANEKSGAFTPEGKPLIVKVELPSQSFYFVLTKDKLSPENYTTVGMTGGGDWPWGLSYLGSRADREGLLIGRPLRWLYRNSIRTVFVGGTTALLAWFSSLTPDTKLMVEGAGGIIAAAGMIGGLSSGLIAAKSMTDDSFAGVDTDGVATQLVSGIRQTQRGWLRTLLSFRKKVSQTFFIASFPEWQVIEPAELVNDIQRKLGAEAKVELITVSDLEVATLAR